MHIVIAGCGRVGAQLAEVLSSENHDVVIIDRKVGSFKRLGDKFHGLCIEGLAFDEETLIDSGIRSAAVFVVVTDSDKSNLMAALIAKRIFNVPKVISRTYGISIKNAVSGESIEEACGTRIITDEILNILSGRDDIRVLQKDEDRGVYAIVVVVGQDPPGLPLDDLINSGRARAAAVLHSGKVERVYDDTVFASGDRVVLVSLEKRRPPENELQGLDRSSFRFLKGRKPEDTRIIIGGCSKVGAGLAERLSSAGFRISVIDNNPAKSERLPVDCHIDFIEGFIYEESALIEAGIEEAAAFVAAGKLDNENLMAAEIAKRIFHVPCVLSRVFNPDKEATYNALGTMHVCGTELVYRSILANIVYPEIRIISYKALPDYDLIEFMGPSIWHGKSVESAVSSTGIVFLYLLRGGDCIFPDGNLELLEDDVLYALATSGMMLKLHGLTEKKRRWFPSTW